MERKLSVLGTEFNDLLRRARRLEPDALAQIHDRYYPEVYRYVRFRLQDERVCEDIASEVFLRLLDALHKQKGPEQNLHGWLLGTASHLVIDHLRRSYAHREDGLDDDPSKEYPSQDLSPEQHVHEAWQQHQVRQAMQKLTPEQQHVLALRFADEFSIEETAQMIGKSVTAVKALQFRAVASLKRLLNLEEL